MNNKIIFIINQSDHSQKYGVDKVYKGNWR